MQGVTARTEKSLTAQFWDALRRHTPDYRRSTTRMAGRRGSLARMS